MKRPPVANEYADRTRNMNYWYVLPIGATPQLGDIVAYHGHVGFYVPRGVLHNTISASSHTAIASWLGEIVWNKWPHVPYDSTDVTIRRCTCADSEAFY